MIKRITTPVDLSTPLCGTRPLFTGGWWCLKDHQKWTKKHWQEARSSSSSSRRTRNALKQISTNWNRHNLDPDFLARRRRREAIYCCSTNPSVYTIQLEESVDWGSASRRFVIVDVCWGAADFLLFFLLLFWWSRFDISLIMRRGAAVSVCSTESLDISARFGIGVVWGSLRLNWSFDMIAQGRNTFSSALVVERGAEGFMPEINLETLRRLIESRHGVRIGLLRDCRIEVTGLFLRSNLHTILVNLCHANVDIKPKIFIMFSNL